MNSGRGSTNFFIGYAFDFGLVGLVLGPALLAMIGWLALRIAPQDLGLAAFLTTLFAVDFQFNNGFRFGFVHVLLAVLIAAAATTGQQQRFRPRRESGA